MKSKILKKISMTVTTAIVGTFISTISFAGEPTWVSFDGDAEPGSFPELTIDTSNSFSFQMRVDIPGMYVAETLEEIEEGGVERAISFQRIEIPGGSKTAEEGKPELPVLTYSIAVPLPAVPGTPTQVNDDIISNAILQAEEYYIAPVREAMIDSDQDEPEDCNQSFPPGGTPAHCVPDPKLYRGTIYQADDFYPAQPVEIEGPVKVRGTTVILVRLFPVQFNPVTKTLRTRSHFDIDIGFLGGFELFVEPKYRAPAFEQLLEGVLQNADAALNPEQDQIFSVANPAYEENNKLLIITAPQFVEAAETLASWKIQKGVETVIKTTTDILGDGSCLSSDATSAQIATFNQKAGQIKNYIQSEYDSATPLVSLLFIGDAECIPTHYKTKHPYHGFNTGTDLYYGTMDGESDYSADIHMGRLSVDTLAEAQKRVQDIIGYEKNPPQDTSFYQKAAVAAYFQDDNKNGRADRRFAQTAEDLSLFLSDADYLGQYQVDRIYYTPSTVTPTYWGYWFGGGPAGSYGGPVPNHLLKPGFPWNGGSSNITNAINDGRFLVSHRDHGSKSGWSRPGYSINSVKNLANGNKLPVVWSINCETGWFHNETDPVTWTGFNTVYFPEAWERNPNGGAAALIAASQVSYSGYNDSFVWGLIDAIYPNFVSYNSNNPPIYEMGAVLNYAKYFLTENYSLSYTVLVELEIFHLFGDPTMEIWTNVPQSLNVSHNTALTGGQTALDVKVNTSDALITVSKENSGQFGEILARAVSSNGKFVALSWPEPLASGDTLHVTVTKHNYRPYTQSSQVGGAEPPPPQEYQLTVAKNGDGQGEVTSTPAGISCGNDCEQPFEEGTTVQLSANAANGSYFEGWAGSCSGANATVQVVIDADETCTAQFNQVTYQLTVSKTGTGDVTSTEGGINCGNDCGHSYIAGQTVNLTATPASGMLFTGWTGACSGTSATTAVTLNSNKACTASFEAEPTPTPIPTHYRLTLDKKGDGIGSITVVPNMPEDGFYPVDTEVQLVASAGNNAIFAGWENCSTSSNTDINVVMNARQDCVAVFELLPTPPAGFYTLTLDTTGSGYGIIRERTWSKPQLHYPNYQKAYYTEGSRVGLAVANRPFSRFIQWLEDDCYNKNRTTVNNKVIVNADSICKVRFESEFHLAAQEAIAAFQGDPNNAAFLTQYPANAENKVRLLEAFELAMPTIVDVEEHVVLGKWPNAIVGVNKVADLPNRLYTTAVKVTTNQAVEISVKLLTTTGSEEEAKLLIPYGAADVDALTDATLLSYPLESTTLLDWSTMCRQHPAALILPDGTCTLTEGPATPGSYLITATKTMKTGSIKIQPVDTESQLAKKRCGSWCYEVSNTYPEGTELILTAVDGENSQFTHWAGCYGEIMENNAIKIVVDQAKTCVANYILHSIVDTTTYQVDIKKSGTGKGIVNCRNHPLTITCGTTCSSSYSESEKITFEALSSHFSDFIEWSTDCPSQSPNPSYNAWKALSDATCTVVFEKDTVLAARELIAAFYQYAMLDAGDVMALYPPANNNERLEEVFRLAVLTLIEVDRYQPTTWPTQLVGIDTIADMPAAYTGSVKITNDETVEITAYLQAVDNTEKTVKLVIYYGTKPAAASTDILLERSMLPVWVK